MELITLQPKTMRLLVSLVLVVAWSQCDGHYLIPVLGNGQIITPYHYVVHHTIPGVMPQGIPDILQNPEAEDVSRETLEDQGPDRFLQNVPDISDEQAHLNPDDSQYPQLPELPRPNVPSYRPNIPSTPQYPLPSRPRPSGEESNVVFNGPHEDGSYDFSYSQVDQSRSEKSDNEGNVQGTYFYKGSDGKDVQITYTAGANKGYIPVGEGLLPPPPAHPQGSGDGQEDEDTQQHVKPVVPTRRPNNQRPAELPRPEIPCYRPTISLPSRPRPIGEESNVVFNGPNEDGSYDFSYSQVDQSRSEKSDNEGNVQGTYSYKGPDGKDVQITYTAGANKGYIPVGEGLLPPPPAHPQGQEGREDEDTQQNVRPVVPTRRPNNQRPVVLPRPEIPSYWPNIPSNPLPSRPRPTGEESNVVFNGPNEDGSYDFSYSQVDQSRSEKSDNEGNVQGTYSYKGPEGKDVQITYTAGANKGYIPVGEGLLPPPPAHPQDQEGGVPQVEERPTEGEEGTQQHVLPVVPTKRPTKQRPVVLPENESHVGMPYSYNYDADLSSKTETADDKGNVQGSYTFIDGAGVKRKISYTVRGDEGFIATGDIHPDPGTANITPPRPSGGSSVVPPRQPSITQDNSIPVRGDTPGVKGQPPKRRPPVSPPTPARKGGNTKGSGWDKYPLGG